MGIEDRRKKAVFDTMSQRRQKHILKKGYDKWDPFQEPKDHIDIRRDPSNRTAHQLVFDFHKRLGDMPRSKAYDRGVLEAALGMVNGDERIKGMYEFSLWYFDSLKD